MPLKPEVDYYTPAEVARMFRVSPKTVSRWSQSGHLTFIKTIGGHRRFVAADVDAYFEGQVSQP